MPDRSSPTHPPAAGVRPDLAALVDLLLPADCPGCGAGVPLCGGCRAGLEQAARRLPVSAGPTAVPVWVVADYGGPTAALIRSWKDGGRRDLARPLSRALAAALHAAWLNSAWPDAAWLNTAWLNTGWLDEAAGPDGAGMDGTRPNAARPGDVGPAGIVVVPVPSGPANRRHRGGDLVADLARRAVGELRRQGLAGPGDLRVLPVLRHRRRVADQAGLGVVERSRNLSGALYLPDRWRPLVAGAGVLVVDDVVTTGASAAEAASALGRAGVRVLAVGAVAYTPRRAAEPATEPGWRPSR